MTITFRYKTITRPDNTKVKAPIIPVLFHGKENIATTALVDSGADISAMPKDFAELLGIELKGKKEIAYGIGGTVESIDSKISVTIEKDHEKYDFLIPIKIILGKHDFPILLGRAGFFDEFIISFDQSKQKISLKKINKDIRF